MRQIEQRADRAYRHQFGQPPDVITSAPGRINLIGEHTDYNGGFVLPCAIERRVAVAASSGSGGYYSADFDELQAATGGKTGSWADYPRGVVWALGHSGVFLPELQAAFAGDVPQGAGLSSSAAIESATALALQALATVHLERQELALLCTRAENQYVGVNSGIMDQYASLLCRPGACLLIDCRSFEAQQVPLDLDANALSLLVCDTGVRRSLAATGYNERRAACERAAQTLGVETLRDATLDDLSRLNDEELRRARHVITENDRVLAAVEALGRSDFKTFGWLMFASHRSLRDDFEVSIPQLDVFVECAREEGALGARLTGAGFGGCAVSLVPTKRVEALQCAALAEFARRGFQPPHFYRFRPAAGAELVE